MSEEITVHEEQEMPSVLPSESQPARIPTIPPYTLDELATRTRDGSVDLPRLAATVAGALTTINALAEWANAQIAQQAQAQAQAEHEQGQIQEQETSRRRGR